jgi:hypothetical protein
LRQILLHSPGWPQTHNPLASASQILGLQSWATMPSESLFFVLKCVILLWLITFIDLKTSFFTPKWKQIYSNILFQKFHDSKAHGFVNHFLVLIDFYLWCEDRFSIFSFFLTWLSNEISSFSETNLSSPLWSSTCVINQQSNQVSDMYLRSR